MYNFWFKAGFVHECCNMISFTLSSLILFYKRTGGSFDYNKIYSSKNGTEFANIGKPKVMSRVSGTECRSDSIFRITVSFSNIKLICCIAMKVAYKFICDIWL